MDSIIDMFWGVVKAALWLFGVFYLLPIVSVLIFDFFEFLMLGDLTLSKFNWIASVQKIHNFYPMILLKAQEMFRGVVG